MLYFSLGNVLNYLLLLFYVVCWLLQGYWSHHLRLVSWSCAHLEVWYWVSDWEMMVIATGMRMEVVVPITWQKLMQGGMLMESFYSIQECHLLMWLIGSLRGGGERDIRTENNLLGKMSNILIELFADWIFFIWGGANFWGSIRTLVNYWDLCKYRSRVGVKLSVISKIRAWHTNRQTGRLLQPSRACALRVNNLNGHQDLSTTSLKKIMPEG